VSEGTIHVRGEGGTIWEMDLPLSSDHSKKVADGRMVRVNPDGSHYNAPVPVEKPPADDDPDGADTDDDEDLDDGDTAPELKAFLEAPLPPVPVKATPVKATKAGK